MIPLAISKKKGLKQPSHLTNDNNSQTVLVCANPTEYTIPPVDRRKTVNTQLTIGEIPGTLYGLSRKGWIDRSLFFLVVSLITSFLRPVLFYCYYMVITVSWSDLCCWMTIKTMHLLLKLPVKTYDKLGKTTDICKELFWLSWRTYIREVVDLLRSRV